MRRTFLPFLVIAFVVFCSCTKQKKDQDIPEISPQYFKDTTLALSQFTSEIIYIPLDSIIQISRVSVIHQVEDMLLIFVREEGWMMYDMQGNYKYHVVKRGSGPGESRNRGVVKIDPIRKHIYINTFHKTIVKDYQGNLVREISGKGGRFNAINMEVVHENNKVKLIFAGNIMDNYKWIITDSIGNIEYKHEQIPYMSKDEYGRFSVNTSYSHSGMFHCWNELNDTIYCLNGRTHKAKYLFKNDKYRLTRENFILKRSGNRNKEIMRIRTVHETDQYLMITYSREARTRLFMYDKFKKRFYNNDFITDNRHYLYLTNDVDAGVSCAPLNYHKNDGDEYFAVSVNALALKEHVGNSEFKNSVPKYPEKKKKLKELANSLDENDNPVLMLIKLKK